MSFSNFGLVKQNTCYEIQYQRKNPTFSPYASPYRRLRPLSTISRDGLGTGSRILSFGRGEATTIKVEEGTVDDIDQSLKTVSISADNIRQSGKISPNKSLVPRASTRSSRRTPEEVISKQLSVVSRSLDARGSPESMRQLRNYVKSITNSHLNSFKDELNKVSEQNKCLREEVNLHSNTISRLLDMTTEKNNLIADIKSRNARLEQEIRIKNEINENFVSLLKEFDDLKKKCLTSDDEKIKHLLKCYLKSKNRIKRSSSDESSESYNSSFSQVLSCSDLLSEIHTHKSEESIRVVKEPPAVKKPIAIKACKSEIQVVPETNHQKFTDSMENVSKKSRKLDFRKIFCCKPV